MPLTATPFKDALANLKKRQMTFLGVNFFYIWLLLPAMLTASLHIAAQYAPAVPQPPFWHVLIVWVTITQLTAYFKGRWHAVHQQLNRRTAVVSLLAAVEDGVRGYLEDGKKGRA